ncbi:hypothetical protein MSKU9_2112 [Komagataeibacter diospyri]|uniref:Uncharacterized protein n=1 Tax=Komagataeibacter diospyri TaxID=1932662 RepID=A0A4P5NVN7_9PROT|nr:hypothetical protein MSKU9_2112 [Komagataeibacter diospyri]
MKENEQKNRITLYQQTYQEASGANSTAKEILGLLAEVGDKPSPIDQIQQLLETIAQQQVQILSSQGKILQRLSALES